jgi:hypothetical protein
VRVKKNSVLVQEAGKPSHLRRRHESQDMILDGTEFGKEDLMRKTRGKMAMGQMS